MIASIEFACLVVAFTLTGVSYFYNVKYKYYYLQKNKAITFLVILALQLTTLLYIRYLNTTFEIYYLLPFNLYYISIFYHTLIKNSLNKARKDYLSYSILVVLFIGYVFVFQYKKIDDLKIYYLIYQFLLLGMLIRCIVKYILLTKFETDSNVSAKWYFQSILVLAVIEIAMFVQNILSEVNLFGLQISSVLYLSFISITMLIFMIKSLMFSEVDTSKILIINKDTEIVNDIDDQTSLPVQTFTARKDKYSKSKLKEDEIAVIRIKLQRIINEKLFLDPELNLEQLSNLFKIPKHSLSQVFSNVFDTNFKDYINYLRCEYALKFILKDNSNLNIIEIAYQSGFNSKTSFYRAFSKVYKCTPLEYRQRVLN